MYAHCAFLEIKKYIKLGAKEYNEYADNVFQGRVVVPARKREWFTRLGMFLLAVVFNFQISFAVFFAVEFFEFQNLYETPVVPDKFSNYSQETGESVATH